MADTNVAPASTASAGKPEKTKPSAKAKNAAKPRLVKSDVRSVSPEKAPAAAAATEAKAQPKRPAAEAKPQVKPAASAPKAEAPKAAAPKAAASKPVLETPEIEKNFNKIFEMFSPANFLAMAQGADGKSMGNVKGYDQLVGASVEQVDRLVNLVNNLLEASRETIEAAIEAGSMGTSLLESVSNELLTFVKATLEESIQAAKAMSEAKSVNEVIDLQTDFARSQLDNIMDEGNKLVEMTNSLVQDSLHPLRERLAGTLEMLTKATKI